MKTTKLNGIRLSVLNQDEAERHGVTDEVLPIDGGEYLYGLVTKGDWLKAAGIWNKVDTDMPIAFFEGMPPEEIREKIDWGVWDYTYEPMFGRYLDIRDLLPNIIGAVRATAQEA